MDAAQRTPAGPGDPGASGEAYREFWLSFDADDEAAPAEVNDPDACDAYEQFWKLADAE